MPIIRCFFAESLYTHVFTTHTQTHKISAALALKGVCIPSRSPRSTHPTVVCSIEIACPWCIIIISIGCIESDSSINMVMVLSFVEVVSSVRVVVIVNELPLPLFLPSFTHIPSKTQSMLWCCRSVSWCFFDILQKLVDIFSSQFIDIICSCNCTSWTSSPSMSSCPKMKITPIIM